MGAAQPLHTYTLATLSIDDLVALNGHISGLQARMEHPEPLSAFVLLPPHKKRPPTHKKTQTTCGDGPTTSPSATTVRTSPRPGGLIGGPDQFFARDQNHPGWVESIMMCVYLCSRNKEQRVWEDEKFYMGNGLE